jgi:hypothetical protein
MQDNTTRLKSFLTNVNGWPQWLESHPFTVTSTTGVTAPGSADTEGSLDLPKEGQVDERLVQVGELRGRW